MIASCGNSGFVIGFEPIPHIYEKLRSDFSLPNVALVRACVSETLGASVPFYHVKERRWISSLSPSHLDGYDVETIQVPVTTLDATLAEMELLDSKRVSFIKLDIEGAEFPAIRGGGGVISACRPFIVFENSLASAGESFGYGADDFFGWFKSHGYLLFDVLGTPLEEWHWKEQRGDVCWNFVAVHDKDPRKLDFLANIKYLLIGIADELKRNGKINGLWAK